jgi:hypothetical protein
MKRAIYGLVAACAVALPLGAALAQEYTQGTAYVEPRGGVYGSTNSNVHVMGTYGGAAGYYVMDGVAVEAEGLGYAVDQDVSRANALGQKSTHEETTGAVGVAGMARWNFVRTPKGTLFVGAGGGGLFADKEVPTGGSKQSGLGQADLGGTLGLSKNVSLRASGRYQHVGEFSDKGLDNLGGHLGLKISF